MLHRCVDGCFQTGIDVEEENEPTNDGYEPTKSGGSEQSDGDDESSPCQRLGWGHLS